jgi:hypothetical protein
MFENWAISKMFGLKMQELMGGWRILHSEELQLLNNNYLGEQLRGMRWVGRVARMRKIKSIQDFGRRT